MLKKKGFVKKYQESNSTAPRNVKNQCYLELFSHSPGDQIRHELGSTERMPPPRERCFEHPT